MKIELSDHHIPVILAALEAYQRFRINQPKTALEQIFPQECFELGWNKMQEICRPFQEAFFPNHSQHGGPSICSEEAGDARIAYEIYKTIEQYVALKKSDGWFGNTVDFHGSDLNPSGLPPPKIEGLDEMQYKDFKIPDRWKVKNLYLSENYSELWKHIKETMPELPRGDKMEIIADIDSGPYREPPTFHVRVYKPRKQIDSEKL